MKLHLTRPTLTTLKSQQGFTLLKILIVLGILGSIMAFVLTQVAGQSEQAKPISSAAGPSAPRPEASESIDVGDEEMKNLLGPELARAMNEAKLIPDPAPGGSGIQGFRLLAVVPGSIYDRVKLQNEDLIIEVNGQSLKDPGQGYRLLESLQQQREITINFTRNGEPMVRKVRVK